MTLYINDTGVSNKMCVHTSTIPVLVEHVGNKITRFRETFLIFVVFQFEGNFVFQFEGNFVTVWVKMASLL